MGWVDSEDMNQDVQSFMGDDNITKLMFEDKAIGEK
jgi:hypothetical protein